MSEKGQRSCLVFSLTLLLVVVISVTGGAILAAENVIKKSKAIEVISFQANDYSFPAEQPQGYDVPLTTEEQSFVRYMCQKYDVPYEVVLGIMEVESGFDPSAVNGDCFGIMQVHKINFEQYGDEWEELGIFSLNSFYEGVEAGCYVLSKCEGDNIEQRLIAYNCGQTAADELIKQGITSTKYSRAVLSYANDL